MEQDIKHFVFKTCVMQQCATFNELPLQFCTDIYIMVDLIFILLSFLVLVNNAPFF